MGSEDRGATVLSVSGLRLSHGAGWVLDGLDLTLHEHDRLALIGRNGCGKSTLLKCLAGALRGSGERSLKRGLRIGYLSQDFALDEDANVWDNVMSGAHDLEAKLVEYEGLSAQSARAHEIEAEITRLDAWDLPRSAMLIMQSLGTPPAQAPVGPLSGGEKRRVAMARTLMGRPELLILDEPTNHLDAESIQWLEGELERFTGAILLVTHDRYFLDRVANRIAELERGRLTFYEGNYSAYLELKAAADMAAEVVEHKRQMHLKRELAWVRQGAKARTTKSRSRLERYDQLSKEEGFSLGRDAELLIPRAPGMSKKPLTLRGVGKAYGGRRLFSGLDLEFFPDTRVGVVGRNGLGKSTLVKIIMGEVPPDEGSVEIGERTVFNYIDQNRLQLNDEGTVLQAIAGDGDNVRLGDETVSARGYLRRYLFSDETINTQVNRLSGGERSRLLLAKMLRGGGNFLILDEPTNDLDLPTLRLLEEAMAAFEGAALIISHDRYFLNRVCDAILAFEGDGQVVYHEGDYDYYLRKRKEREQKQMQQEHAASKKAAAAVGVEAAAPVPAVMAGAQATRKLKWSEQKELENMEAAIAAAEAAVAAVQAELEDPTTFSQRPQELMGLSRKLEAAEKELERLYARWQELEALKGG